MNIDRRLFLFTFTAPLYSAAPLVVLSAGEARTFEALADAIIPPDEQSAGARQAGVLYYVDRQLQGPLKRYAAAYHAGLTALAADCRQKTSQEFDALDPGARTRYLEEVEKSGPAEVRGFFQLAVDHTMQGFYGAPEHGGNRDEVSWKMLGVTQMMHGGGHQH